MMNVVPSDLASDETFIRRVYIDTIGQLPTADEVREFLADTDPKKREKLIDKLLAHPLHAAVWATKLSDVTGNNTQALEQPAARRSRSGRRCGTTGSASGSPTTPPTTRWSATSSPPPAATARNPTSGSRSSRRSTSRSAKGFRTDYPDKKTLDLFWRRQQQVPVEQWGEKVAAAFLGVRLECAQCHKHPTDRWTQDEYWAFANIFAPVMFQQQPVQQPGR